MKGLTTLAVASSILSVNALNLVQPRDGQQARVVQHKIQRNKAADPRQRIQLDHERMRKRSSGNGTIQAALQNEATLYFMDVSIGTPTQIFRLHLDTGSSDLWVNVDSSSLCDGQGNPCAASGTYNANESSTYTYLNSDFNITYVDGSGSAGDYATDTVSFGSAVLTNQQLGIGYTSSSYEGIIGIGYPSNEVEESISGKSYPNVPANLVDHGYIASNAYSLWLDRLSADFGSILFGGVDTTKYSGSLETLPVVKEDGIYAAFLIGLTAIGANGSAGSIASNMASPALLDSGSSLMYLPDDVAESIYSSVGAEYDEAEGAAIVNCDLANTDYTIDFTFSSPTISVSMQDMVIVAEQRGSQKTCILGIGKAGSSTPVLGDTFLRSAYVVYDIENNEISIAQSNFGVSGSSNILEITNTSGVPSATAVANPVSITAGSSGGARNNDEPDLSSGAAVPTAAASYKMAALGVAGAGLLLAL